MEILKYGKEVANEISNFNSVAAFYSNMMKN
jgi:hypothetical protein